MGSTNYEALIPAFSSSSCHIFFLFGPNIRIVTPLSSILDLSSSHTAKDL
jgi:hypothetical protein